MICMRTFIKAFVAILLLGGILTTAQAASTIGVTGTLAAKISVDVTAGASQTWTLDPTAIYQATIPSAITVKCNKATWTVQAAANHAQLTDGTNTLSQNFYVDATGASTGTGYNWTSSTTAGDLWKDGGKGSSKSTGLKVSQSVSWDDDISTSYATQVTITAAVT